MDVLGLGIIQINDWFLLFIIFLITAYVYLTWNFGFFTSRGIGGPKPLPFLGTMLGMFREGMWEMDRADAKKYGKTYGSFEGRRPVLVTRDPELMKQIFVKEHPNFINHGSTGMGTKITRNFLSTARDDHWKALRSTVSPTFSTGKLRLMTKQINKCAEALVENIQQEADKGESLEAKDYAGSYTMDVIASTAFGLQIDSQKDKDNSFVRMAKKAFDFSMFNPVFIMLFLFPFLLPILNYFKIEVELMPPEVLKFFSDVTDQTIKAREKSGEKRNDFISLMMNAHKERQEDDKEHDAEFQKAYGSTVKRGLTKDEVLAQAILFFLAGYDTTASSIAFCIYNLTINPEYQEKLYEEIERVVGDKEVDYNILCQLEFLEMCCNESLRMYPPAERTDRESTQDTTINGMSIPKETKVVLPIYAQHYDPEIWPEPENFNPYRWTPEEKAKHETYDWLPFGGGPRNCVAMRLALTELKIAMVYLIRAFRFVRTSKTEVPIQMNTTPILGAKNGIWLKFEQR